MNVQNHINLEYALIKYFSNRASLEEELFVRDWVSQNSDNASYYQKIKRLWVQRIVL